MKDAIQLVVRLSVLIIILSTFGYDSEFAVAKSLGIAMALIAWNVTNQYLNYLDTKIPHKDDEET